MSVFPMDLNEQLWLFCLISLVALIIILIVLFSLKKKTKTQNEILENIASTLMVVVANLEKIAETNKENFKNNEIWDEHLLYIEDNLRGVKKILKNINKGFRKNNIDADTKIKLDKISMQIDYIEKLIMLENMTGCSEEKPMKRDEKIENNFKEKEEQEETVLAKILMAQNVESVETFHSSMGKIGLQDKKNNIGRSGKEYTREEIENIIK